MLSISDKKTDCKKMSIPARKAGRPRLYSTAQKLAAKALFLRGKSYKEIEAETQILQSTLRNFVHEEDWRGIRSDPESKAKAKAAVEHSLERFNAEITNETQSLALDSTQLVRDAINAGSARNAKDSAMAVKTLVEISRITGGNGAKDTPSLGAGVNMFFFAGAVKRVGAEVNVAPPPLPAVELAAPVAGTADPEF